MGRSRKMIDATTSEGNSLLSDLFENRKKRVYTLSVDEDTYEMVTRVSDQTKKSRPKILAAFVKLAYDSFCEEAKAAGIRFDPNAPVNRNHKGRRKK